MLDVRREKGVTKAAMPIDMMLESEARRDGMAAENSCGCDVRPLLVCLLACGAVLQGTTAVNMAG